MKTKLIIFGITGDLSRRKLLPALLSMVEGGEYDNLSIIGVSRREVDVPALVTESTGSDQLASITRVFTMDLTVAGDYVRLSDDLDNQLDEQVLIYLSVPPSAVADIVDFLGLAGLNTPQVKLLFEKPFGFDLASAEDFIARTGRYFKESQIYRIDHYAAKAVAAEMIRLRTNDAATQQWGSESVTDVEIIASEKIGIEGRTTFYEETGALRDFIQGHLLQLLSLVLMDIGPQFTIDSLPAHRLRALQQLQTADPEKAVRAQYEGYRAEVSNSDSITETFASLSLTTDDNRWAGVSLRLTTGKNLDKKQSAIIIRHKDGTERVFDEAMITAADATIPEAYERVLVEAILGHKHIFTTSDEILRSWQIVAPVQATWAVEGASLLPYKPGTSAGELIY